MNTLEESDFIEYYQPFGNSKREMCYRLIDPFCLFYLNQVDGKRRKDNFWQENENLSSLSVWRGRAFENACISHIEQIKKALGVVGVSSDNSPWTIKGNESKDGMQIDLIIKRSDRVVNVCEMKFVNSEFEVKKEYETKLRDRLNQVKELVSRIHNIQMTLVTTYGLKYGIHSGVFQKTVVLDDLFSA